MRKRQYWTEEKTTSKRSGNTAPAFTADCNTRDTLRGHAARSEADEARSEGSSDDVHFRELRPFYETERLNNNSQVCGLISWMVM